MNADKTGEMVTNEPRWEWDFMRSLERHSLSTRTRVISEKPLCEITDAVRFARERLGFEPDEEQARALRGGQRGIVLCTRQWGKSTVMAAKAVHRAYTVPGSLILLLSPCLRQSGEFLLKAEEFVNRLGIKIRSDRNNLRSIVFPNGSRIVALPQNEAKVRGFSKVSLLLIDEASRVSDELYRAMRPTLAVGNGDLWLMSTPNGKIGFFHEEWTHGGDRWARIRVAAPDCPRIDASFLADERASASDAWYRQEHLCEFVEREGAVFSQESIDAALQDYEPMGP
jgi:hypothetical protein